MSKSGLWGIFVLALVGFVSVFYLRLQEKTPETAVEEVETIAFVEESPAIRHPVPEAPPEEEPLPSLDESDAAVRNRFSELFERREFRELIFLDQIIRRIVITVDNLPRKTVPQKFMPLRPPADAFLPEAEEDATFLDPENYKRYTPYVRLFEAIDTKRLVPVYVRLYPLFQSAYVELGYPDGYFNDRLIEVIDHLLETPDVEQPVALVRPKVFYLYADPQLEALSAGQKILIRTGPENTAVVKNRLRQLGHELRSLPSVLEDPQ
jgi:hypothetical protein